MTTSGSPDPESEPFHQAPGFDGADMSDAELDALLAGALPSADADPSDLPSPGDNVHGLVLEIREGEVLVELDSKALGAINAQEFGEELPASGDDVTAQVESHDGARDLIILSVSEHRRQLFWDRVTPGDTFEGRVTGVNKGGLTLELRGARAFMPLSQIARERVENPETFVGQSLKVMVTDVDREGQDLVVSRRALLEEEAAAGRSDVLAALEEGQVVEGRVVRVNQHGAFIDLGGVDGLLHISKYRGESGVEPAPGQKLHVEIARIDRDRQRISLELHRLPGEGWAELVADYEVGQRITGLVRESGPDGVVVLIEEGVEGRLVATGDELPRRGQLISAEIVAIDPAQREVRLGVPGN